MIQWVSCGFAARAPNELCLMMVILFTICLGLDYLVKKKKNWVSVKGLSFTEMLALFCLKKQCVSLFTAAVMEYQRLDIFIARRNSLGSTF